MRDQEGPAVPLAQKREGEPVAGRGAADALRPFPAAAHPWDAFLVGPENDLAHAAARSLARGEEVEGLSPLVVHGPAGSGKSRLLAGLVFERLLRRPESVVAHLDAESFAAACAEAASSRAGWAELRDRFRSLDLFVLEDLHALARAPLALAELVPTLDALDAAGAAVAVSARAAPGAWGDLPRRLVSRLSGGLSVGIDPPGLDARRRYLLDQARRRRLTVPADVVETLAGAADGYRTLDGLLARLALEAKVTRGSIDARRLESTLSEPGSIADPVPLSEIARVVAAKFGVRPNALRSASRRPGVVAPRHLAMYLARRCTGLSYAAIGRYFGRRDPATVRHACAMAAERLAADPALAALADNLSSTWRRGDPAEAVHLGG